MGLRARRQGEESSPAKGQENEKRQLALASSEVTSHSKARKCKWIGRRSHLPRQLRGRDQV